MNRKTRSTLLVLSALLTATSATAQVKPVTLTYFSSNSNGNWVNMQDEVGKEITRRTGVTLNAEFAIADPKQKVSLMAASGNYPCLISPKDQAGLLIDAGAMLELSDLLSKHGPNIKKVMGNQFDRMRFSNKDRGIYFIPNNTPIRTAPFDSDPYFKVQLAALKEAGYPKVTTLADYEKVIAAYVKKHPTTADGKPTIGLSLLADDWRFPISVTNPAVLATGAPDDGEFYIDPKTYAAKPHYFRADERAYFKWLNGMNAKGLLDKESFTQKYDQYIAKIASGRVVALTDANWQIWSGLEALWKANMDDKAYARFPVVVKAGTRSPYNQPTGFSGGYGIGISKSCKDPVAAMKFLDFMASDEGQILNSWGVKGKHWTVVNGKRQFIPAVYKLSQDDPKTFRRTTGIGNYWISAYYGDGIKDSTGNYYTPKFPEEAIRSQSAAEKAALAAYKVKFWGDLTPKASTFKARPYGSAWTIPVPNDNDLSEFGSIHNDIVKKYIPRAILAPPAEFDKIYTEMLNEMTRRTGKYWPMMAQLVKDRMSLWNTK